MHSPKLLVFAIIHLYPNVFENRRQKQQHQETILHKKQPPPTKCVFEDATNDFGVEGTPALTRAASPLSCLSFDDDEGGVVDMRPTPRPPPPMAAPNGPAGAPSSAAGTGPTPPSAGRCVVKSASEINFRNVFLDEVG